MPLSSLGLAFTDTFVFAFRDSQSFPGNGGSSGQIIITNGPLPSKVTLYRFRDNGERIVVREQENIPLTPFQQTYLYTEVNNEYQIVATNPVMGGIQARMGTSPQVNPGDAPDPSARFYDARLIMPLTNDGITWPRSGNVSAPYDNTLVRYYVRDNVTGEFVVSPGSPVDFDNTTGATDQDYEPNGATRVQAVGLISAYSGADSAGLEASPLMPTSAMSQLVAQPFSIDDTGDGGNSSVAIASPYEGTARYYEWDNTAKVAVLKYTIPLRRGNGGSGITPTTPADQLFPCAGIIANEPGFPNDPSVLQLDGDLGPGYVIADVPITVVSQNATPTFIPEIRSQNGTVTTGIVTDDDETLMLGWTPPLIKAELTTDTDGYIRKREITADGSPTYPLV
jgi:hypothetical protein